MGDGRYILGIDPGFTGAIALYDPVAKQPVDVWDTPLIQTGMNREVDLVELSKRMKAVGNLGVKLCVIERVGSMPNQGLQSTFKFGQTFGILAGMVAAQNIPILYVIPAVWKAHMGLGSDKKESIDKCKTLFPKSAEWLYMKKHDGRAEAILLSFLGSELKL